MADGPDIERLAVRLRPELTRAFPGDELRDLLLHSLGLTPEAILKTTGVVSPAQFDAEVVDWCVRHGLLSDLAAGAVLLRPGDEALLAAAEAVPGYSERLAAFQSGWRPRQGEGPAAGVYDLTPSVRIFLSRERALTTNVLTSREGVRFTLDELHVPTEVAERRKREARADVAPGLGSRLYDAADDTDARGDRPPRRYSQDEFFEEVLRARPPLPGRGRRVALVGGPGVGKTTLLRTVADWLLDQRIGLPVWVSLAAWRDSGRPLGEYLRDVWLAEVLQTQTPPAAARDALVLACRTGAAWLLLDGLDETGDEPVLALSALGAGVRGWVEPANVAVTCRLNVWDAGRNALESFEAFRCLEFGYGDAAGDADQVGQFLAGWFRDDPELGRRLRDELDRPEQARVKDLARNPLRLALLCLAWSRHPGGGLPPTVFGLYEQFREAFYDWKSDRFPTPSAARRDLDAALGRLALRAIGSPASRFRLPASLVRAELGGPGDPLFDLALNLGWLNRVGVARENPATEVFAFFHPTFQEFHAARAVPDRSYLLDHRPADPPTGTYRVFDPAWKEVTRLWLGRTDVAFAERAALLDALADFDDRCDGAFRHRGVALAGALASELGDQDRTGRYVGRLLVRAFGKVQRGEGGKFRWTRQIEGVETLARAALREADRETVFDGLMQLTELLVSASWNTQVFASVREALRDAVTGVRPESDLASVYRQNLACFVGCAESRPLIELALDVLGGIAAGDVPTAEALESRLGAFLSTEHFDHLTVTLARVGGEDRLAAALASCVGTVDTPSARSKLVTALVPRASRSPAGVPALVGLLRAESDPDVLRAALTACAAAGVVDPELTRTLVARLTGAGDAALLTSAAEELGAFARGVPEAVAFLQSLEAEATSGPFATAAHPVDLARLRVAAFSSRLRLNPDDRGALDGLQSLAEPPTGPDGLPAPRAEHPRADPRRAIRLLALRPLARLGVGNATTVERLHAWLASDPDLTVRYEIAEAWLERDPSRTDLLDVLVGILPAYGAPYWAIDEVVFRAARTLGEHAPGHAGAVTTLTELLGRAADSRSLQTLASLLSLAAPGHPAARDAIAAAYPRVRGRNERFNMLASFARAARKSPQYEAVVFDAIQNDPDGVRETVVRNFRSLGIESARVRDALVSLGRHPPEGLGAETVCWALHALPNGDPAAVDWLSGVLTTTFSESTLRAARLALVANLPPDQMPPLVTRLTARVNHLVEAGESQTDACQACVEVLLHCAENLDYPTYFAACRSAS